MTFNTYDGLAVFKPIGSGGYGSVTAPKTLVAGANISIVTNDILQTQTISTAAPVGVSRYVDLTDVSVPAIPIPHALSYYDPVSAKFKQTAAVTFDSSSNFGVETPGAAAIVANGGPASLQSTNQEVVVASALDCTLSAAAGNVKIFSLAQEIQHFSTGDTTFQVSGPASVLAISGEIETSYSAKVTAAGGNSIPNKRFVTDAISNAIVSASDVVSKQIQFEATTMGIVGGGVAQGKISIAPALASLADVTSFVASNFASDFADPGYIPLNILSELPAGSLFTFRWVSSGEVTEASYLSTSGGTFHAAPAASFEFSLSHISGGFDASLPPLDAVVYFSYTPAQPAPTPPDLSGKATIGGDASVEPNYILGTTVSSTSGSSEYQHHGVSVLTATTSATFLDGRDAVFVTASDGDLVCSSVNGTTEIRAPSNVLIETTTNNSSINLTNVDTRIVRDTQDRVLIDATTTEISAIDGNIVFTPDPVNGIVTISSNATDYAALISTAPNALTNVSFVNGVIRSAGQFTSCGRNSVYSGDVQLATNSNTVYHNSISYISLNNITTAQFDCLSTSLQCRLALYSGWDNTAVLLSQTAPITPVLGLNTVSFLTPFNLSIRQAICIGFSVQNNTLKLNSCQGVNSITRGWNSAGSVVLTGFPVNPQAKSTVNQTNVLINVF